MSFHFFHHHLSRKASKRADRMAMAVGVLQPLTTIPQILSIYNNSDATNVSLVTWLASALSGLVFLWYGIVHRLKPIIVTQILWFILQMIVVIEIVVYG